MGRYEAKWPLSQGEQSKSGWAKCKMLVHWPLQQGAWAGRQLTRSSPTDQMFHVSEILA